MAKNDAGVTELLFPLEVLVAPQFTEFFHNPDVTLHAGEELDLDCDVSGDPEPQVRGMYSDWCGKKDDLFFIIFFYKVLVLQVYHFLFRVLFFISCLILVKLDRFFWFHFFYIYLA